MTTLDTMPSFRDYALMRVSLLAQKRAKKARVASTHVNIVLSAIIRVMLHVAGFGLLTLAGFQWNIIAGLVVAGLSCFAMSTLLTAGNQSTNAAEVGRAPDLRTGR